MKSKHPEAIKGIKDTKDIKDTRIAEETKETTIPETEIKAPTKETIVPVAKIDDPFLAKPIEVYAHIETPETKDSITNRTATEDIKDSEFSTVTSPTAETKEIKDIEGIRDTKETVVEPSKVEPQKKTVEPPSNTRYSGISLASIRTSGPTADGSCRGA